MTILGRLVIVAILILSPLCASTVEAHRRRAPAPRPFERGFELTTLFTYTDFESQVEIDNDLGLGFRFGYLFTPRHEIEVMFNSVLTEDEVFPAIDVDVFNFQVAYVHNFRRSGVIPYLTAGLGFIETDDESLGRETDPIVGVGGGIRFFAGPVFHIRLEYRYNQFEGDGDVYVDGEDFRINEFAFGLGWRFPA